MKLDQFLFYQKAHRKENFPCWVFVTIDLDKNAKRGIQTADEDDVFLAIIYIICGLKSHLSFY